MTNVRMIQRRNYPRLALETRFQIRVFRKMLRQNFYGDVAAKPRIVRAINLAHSARTERRNDLIRTELGSNRESHRPELSHFRITLVLNRRRIWAKTEEASSWQRAFD